MPTETTWLARVQPAAPAGLRLRAMDPAGRGSAGEES